MELLSSAFVVVFSGGARGVFTLAARFVSCGANDSCGCWRWCFNAVGAR